MLGQGAWYRHRVGVYCQSICGQLNVLVDVIPPDFDDPAEGAVSLQYRRIAYWSKIEWVLDSEIAHALHMHFPLNFPFNCYRTSRTNEANPFFISDFTGKVYSGLLSWYCKSWCPPFWAIAWITFHLKFGHLKVFTIVGNVLGFPHFMDVWVEMFYNHLDIDLLQLNCQAVTARRFQCLIWINETYIVNKL